MLIIRVEAEGVKEMIFRYQSMTPDFALLSTEYQKDTQEVTRQVLVRFFSFYTGVRWGLCGNSRNYPRYLKTTIQGTSLCRDYPGHG